MKFVLRINNEEAIDNGDESTVEDVEYEVGELLRSGYYEVEAFREVKESGVAEGVCDWCGRERLLETGDERSKIQGGKLWCGTCRGGSKDRYQNYDNERLQGQIDIMDEMLAQHPIEDNEHVRMRWFKLDYQDESWRMKEELKFREEEV